MLVPEKIDGEMYAPCGVNCMICYKHCNSKNKCEGCFKKSNGKPEHCRRCNIKDCICENNIEYCFECEKYPCKYIKNIDKSYKKRYGVSVLENSEYVKLKGIECFLDNKRIRYSCQCGGIISLNDGICSECNVNITGNFNIFKKDNKIYNI